MADGLIAKIYCSRDVNRFQFPKNETTRRRRTESDLIPFTFRAVARNVNGKKRSAENLAVGQFPAQLLHRLVRHRQRAQIQLFEVFQSSQVFEAAVGKVRRLAQVEQLQVLQAGQHKLIYLEVEPDMVTSIARQAGFDTKARDSQRSMQLDLSFPGRHSPLLLFDAADPANLGRVAELLRRVHALAVPTPSRQVTPLQWIEIYDGALSRRTSTSSDPALRALALSRTQALAELPRAVEVVCHSDLHVMNLLQESGSLILLDWEYAHVTDPLWDLAGWCANNDFDAELQWRLLRRYLGKAPILSEWHRFRLLLALYDYVCLLWSQLYLNVRGEEAQGAAERARLLDARLHLPAHYAA